MDKIELTTTERAALQYGRLHHPHPRGQRTMAARSLQSQGLAPEDLWRLGAMATTTFYRDLHADCDGGSAQLQEGS